MPPSDFNVLNNFCAKTHSWKSHTELAVKQPSGCLCQRNMACSPKLNPLDYYVWGKR